LNILDNRRAADFVRAIGEYWQRSVGSDPAYAKIVIHNLLIHTELLVRRWGSLADAIKAPLGSGLYIIPSQLHIEHPELIEPLKKTGRLRLAYFVHDILPVMFPEYFPPDAEDRCRRRMQAAARLADYIIANSHDTAEAFRSTFAPDRDPRSIVVAPLGLRTVGPRRSCPPTPSPYFVIVGTIEPRKNHLMILNIWRRLGKENHLKVPRLIIVGSPAEVSAASSTNFCSWRWAICEL
jgi:glycosyltransferase involved in cell wall biosynthesis